MKAGMDKIIYLDHAATTPLARRVLDAMLPFLSERQPGNAHARHHGFGAVADKAVQTARGQIAERIGALPEEILFTSGATEANNLIINGLARHLKATGKTHIVTCAVEHKSVLEPLKELKGFTLSILPVKPCGMIEADKIEKALTPETGFVTIQAVNNETGTIQSLAEISAMLRGRGVLFHTDAAQALGKIDFNTARAGVDFSSLSSHKAYGPQGIGALYIKSGLREFLTPMQRGGGQEQGLRSGTLPTALCAGFGAACALIRNNQAVLQKRRERFLERLAPLQPLIHGHADPAWNTPGILNIRFPGIDNEVLVMALPGLAFGVGSACGGADNVPSPVITAMTGSEQAAKEAIRLSFGGLTGMLELQEAANQILAAVTEIRKMQEAA